MPAFRQVGEKQLPQEVVFMAWSPKRDLIALANRAGEVSAAGTAGWGAEGGGGGRRPPSRGRPAPCEGRERKGREAMLYQASQNSLRFPVLVCRKCHRVGAGEV